MSVTEMIAEILSALQDPALPGFLITVDRNHRRTRALPISGETNG